MKTLLVLAGLAAAFPLLAQTPAPAPAVPPAPAAAAAQAPNMSQGGAALVTFPELPTKKKPFTIEGMMTATVSAPTYTAVGGRGEGALLKEGLMNEGHSGGGRVGAKRGGGSEGTGGGMRNHHTYVLQVPPKAKLMVHLECRRLRNFNLRFYSDTNGRTEDPGLFVNKLHHRDDAAFYENKTDQMRTINCVLLGVEPITDEPYKLIFTDY